MTISKIKIFYCILLFLSGAGYAVEENIAWKELKQKHFVIYYVNDIKFARLIGRNAEKYYTAIGNDLGFVRYDNFWLWGKRAKIYIYANRADFLKATGAPSWAVGKANPDKRLIATFHGSKGFIESVLPHEMTHLIFMEFIGFTRPIPLWLNEGVAQWEDVSRRADIERFVKKLSQVGGGLIPLSVLVNMDVRTVKSSGVALVFYAQATSLVGFMIEKYGATHFRKFCGQLRDGKSINEALRFTYHKKICNVSMLEKEWYKYLKNE